MDGITGFLHTLLSFWYVGILLVAILMYKVVLRVFFGMIMIPEDKIGLVIKKFVLMGDKRTLPEGRIVAYDGEAGYQAQTLPPGLHWGKWFWQYTINLQSLTTINGNKVGLIKARDGVDLPNGQILARYVECDNFQDAIKFMKDGGFKGRQTQILTPGTYRINTLLFEVLEQDAISVPDGMVGIVTVKDGAALPVDAIAGDKVLGHNKFQDADKFLQSGGNRGLQVEVVLSGLYNINPWFAAIEMVPMTLVPISTVGVVISYFGPEGKDVSGDDFKHGNIVSKGEKGVWAEPLQPGKYAINTKIAKVEIVPTSNLVLNWADSRTESHKLDENLCTITVRSKDGFTFNLDVSQIIHVPMNDAPKVIARFSDIQNLVNQVLEPTIGNYFRNSAQDCDVISFLSQRKERQEAAKEVITAVLAEYNVVAVDTLIGDITPPAELMKTLTNRKIAEENDLTYEQQTKTEETRQRLQKQSSLADIQPQVVSAEQGVLIAERTADAAVKKATGERDAVKLAAEGKAYQTKQEAEAESDKIKQLGQAEAGKIEAIGKSTANAYKLQVDAMGQENFAKLKIFEEIAAGKIKIIPDLMMGGNNGSVNPIDTLLGFEILDKMKANSADIAKKKDNDGTSKN